MKVVLALLLALAGFCGPALADEPVQQGRSVAVCADRTPVCATLKNGSSAEMYECQARQAQAVRILPGACWDAD